MFVVPSHSFYHHSYFHFICCCARLICCCLHFVPLLRLNFILFSIRTDVILRAALHTYYLRIYVICVSFCICLLRSTSSHMRPHFLLRLLLHICTSTFVLFVAFTFIDFHLLHFVVRSTYTFPLAFYVVVTVVVGRWCGVRWVGLYIYVVTSHLRLSFPTPVFYLHSLFHLFIVVVTTLFPTPHHRSLATHLFL